MKIKILLCSPVKGSVGGIQRWTNHIRKYYLEIINQTDIELQTYNMSRKTSVVLEKSIFKRTLLGIMEYPILIKGFKRSINNSDFNVIHITSSASISLLKDYIMLKIAKKKRVKSIIHFRFGRIPEIKIKNNWEYKLLKKVIELADIVVVIDLKSYNALYDSGFKNIEFLPNPVSPEINEIIKRYSKIKKDLHKIVFTGHVKKSKGIFELIEACKNIENISVKLIGPISEEVREEINRVVGINNSWLTIMGELDYETTIKEMMSAGVFVLPTYTEGFPNVILESMACSCPIVASSVGAIPEMLNNKGDKEYGICIEPKNVNQLKLAIEKMLNNPEFARECGKNAQKRVNQLYSMPIVWNQLTKLWKSLI